MKIKDDTLKIPLQRIYQLEIENNDLNGNDMRKLISDKPTSDDVNEEKRELETSPNTEEIVKTRSGHTGKNPANYSYVIFHIIFIF